MLSTGEIIKVLLDEKGMNTKDLVKITGLKETAVTNVLYNRTNKAEYLNRIAKALEIPIDTLLKSKKTLSINTQKYKLSADIVFLVLGNLGVGQLSSKLLIEYIDSAYEHLMQNNEPDLTKIYIQGMIDGHITFGMLKKTDAN
jgi:transcriptional regulator with XRE-family HTH domain